jgi:hypothetical protein
MLTYQFDILSSIYIYVSRRQVYCIVSMKLEYILPTNMKTIRYIFAGLSRNLKISLSKS